MNTDEVITDPRDVSETMNLIDFQEYIDRLRHVSRRWNDTLNLMMKDGAAEEDMAMAREQLAVVRSEIKRLMDYYLGRGSLTDEGRANTSAWGANRSNFFEPPTLNVAEASAICEIVKIANALDETGLTSEASYLDKVLASYVRKMPEKIPSDFRYWLRRELLRNNDRRIDARDSVKWQMITVNRMLKDNADQFYDNSYYLKWAGQNEESNVLVPIERPRSVESVEVPISDDTISRLEEQLSLFRQSR